MLVRVRPTMVMKHAEAREEIMVKLVTWSVCTVDLQDKSSDRLTREGGGNLETSSKSLLEVTLARPRTLPSLLRQTQKIAP